MKNKKKVKDLVKEWAKKTGIFILTCLLAIPYIAYKVMVGAIKEPFLAVAILFGLTALPFFILIGCVIIYALYQGVNAPAFHQAYPVFSLFCEFVFYYVINLLWVVPLLKFLWSFKWFRRFLIKHKILPEDPDLDPKPVRKSRLPG